MNAKLRILLLSAAAFPLTACVDPYYAGGYPPPPPGPVVVAPARPVYVTPRPVYVAPRPVYRPAYGHGYYHGPRRW